MKCSFICYEKKRRLNSQSDRVVRNNYKETQRLFTEKKPSIVTAGQKGMEERGKSKDSCIWIHPKPQNCKHNSLLVGENWVCISSNQLQVYDNSLVFSGRIKWACKLKDYSIKKEKTKNVICIICRQFFLAYASKKDLCLPPTLTHGMVNRKQKEINVFVTNLIVWKSEANCMWKKNWPFFFA